MARNAAGQPLGKQNFIVAALGGGGFCTGLDIAGDGAMVTQSDVFNSFVKSATAAQWSPMFNPTSLPNGTYPPANANTIYQDGSPIGGYATAIAPSNSQHVYGTYDGYWWHSSNQGASWTKIGGPYATPANNVAPRLWNNKCVIDPTNPLKAMLGTTEGKIVYVTDGATPNVLTVAAGATTNGAASPHLVAVNADGTRWAYSVAGTGVYESTTGIAGSYSLLAGSPTNPCHLSYEADGNLWALQYSVTQTATNNNIYKKTPAGSFTNLSNVLNDIAFLSLAVNPQNTNQIVVISEDGIQYQSLDGGANWNEWVKFFNDVNTYPTAIGWMTAGKPNGLTPAKIKFHPTNGRLYGSHGSGVSWSVPPTTPGDPWNWFDDTLGIENLEANHVAWPPGGNPIFLVGDFGAFIIKDRNRHTNQRHIPGNPGDSSAWFLDWAPEDPSFYVLCCAFYNGDGNCHGYSNDYGENWHKFLGAHPSGLVLPGGQIVAASKLDLYWKPEANVDPAESHDGGVTWTLSSFPGITQGLTENGWGFGIFNPHHVFCVDKTNGDVYAYNYGPTGHESQEGIYRRPFGTSSWVKQGGRPGGAGGDFGSGTGLLQCVPGRTGELLYKGNSGGKLWKSTDLGVSWSVIPNVSNLGTFACGKAAPGQSYPAIYLNGTVNAAGDHAGVGRAYSLWRSDDGMVSWVSLDPYPTGNLSDLSAIAASLDNYGDIAIGTGGGGGMIGSYNCPITLS